MLTTMRFLLLLAVLWNVRTAHGQEPRPWSAGPLSWNEFRIAKALGPTSSKLHWTYHLVPERTRIQDTLVVFDAVQCRLNGAETWVDTAFRTDDLLRYYQLAFDLAELCGRRMAGNLRTNTLLDPKVVLNASNAGCDQHMMDMRKETDDGRDRARTEQWAKRVQEELTALPVEPFAHYRITDWGFGFQLSLGGALLGGTLREHFSYPFGLGYGLNFRYRRSYLSLGGLLAGTRLQRPLNGAREWQPGDAAGFAHLHATVGHALLEDAHFRITPYFGLGIAEVSLKGQQTARGDAFVAYAPLVGLNIDHKLRKCLRLGASNHLLAQTGRAYNETVLRVGINLMDASSMPRFGGHVITITAGVCWYGSGLRQRL